MATAPTVQNLSDIMAELNPSIQGQTDVINKQKAANAAIYDAQRAGLEGAKTKAFNQINDQATGRGMAFSGIPLNEQANYLADKYLPGIQEANARQNMDALAYDKTIADMNTNVFNKAFDTRVNQTNQLNSWNQMLSGQDFSRSEREAGQAWQATQSQLDRDFRMSEAEKERNFTAAQNAASRAASASRGGGGGGGGSSMTPQEKIQAFLMSSQDANGNVSQGAWSIAASMAKAAGQSFGGEDGFANTYWGFANDKEWKKYKEGYERYM